ncbi:MAG: BadF/BadG/BcrA/BcrD ATPase family protein [bacterium]
MPYVLGIDGGGTKTLCLISDERGRILGGGLGGPSAYVDRGGEIVLESLRSAISGALKSAGVSPLRFAAVCVSLGGRNTEEMRQFVHRIVDTPKVTVIRETEGEVVFDCAPIWGYDVAVLAGTGSVAMGVNRDGQKCIVGGWGCLIDDRGSAYDIGRNALTAVARAIDGRGTSTALVPKILDSPLIRPNIPDEESVWNSSPETKSRIEDAMKMAIPQLGRREVAALAPIVSEAAKEGDAVAQRILGDAGRELGLLATTVIRNLGMRNRECTVIGVGGAFRAQEALWDAFEGSIRRIARRAKVMKSDFHLAVGATALALKDAGLLNEDAIRNVKETWRNYSCGGE